MPTDFDSSRRTDQQTGIGTTKLFTAAGRHACRSDWTQPPFRGSSNTRLRFTADDVPRRILNVRRNSDCSLHWNSKLANYWQHKTQTEYGGLTLELPRRPSWSISQHHLMKFRQIWTAKLTTRVIGAPTTTLHSKRQAG